MRREFATMAAVLTAYACALVLGSLIICVGAGASDVEGERATPGNAAHVRIERCSVALDSLCGVVRLLQDIRTGPSGEANEGRIYNPENGRTYRASLNLRTP